MHRYHAVIHRCLNQAVRWEWTNRNVSDAASPPTEPRRRFAIQPVDTVARLIEAAEKSRQPELGVAFRLLAALGGRRGEVVGLRWSAVGLTTGAVRVD